ncbi:MAG: hypothetical protein RLO50_08665 [Azospirillaceae bacterium]
MSKLALIIKTRTKPGRRDDVIGLWEEHLKHRAAANADQESYFLCLDNRDADVFILFEVYRNPATLAANAEAAWFQDYMNAVMPLLDGPPEVHQTTPFWEKHPS